MSFQTRTSSITLTQGHSLKVDNEICDGRSINCKLLTEGGAVEDSSPDGETGI